MKKMKYQNVKGTQDYLPEAEEVRRYIRRKLEDVFIQYGYKPLETPILNYSDLLASKYGGGAEILEEMYTLTDRGERDLALRYDLTIPFAKVIGMNPTLGMPFKRYEIGKVFRDGPIKTGRFREFTQCDVDIVGVETQMAEAELLLLVIDVFRQLNMKVQIQFNNRKLLVGMLEVFKTNPEKINNVILILDKLKKVGLNAVVNELEEQELSAFTVDAIKEFLMSKNNSNYNYFVTYAKQNEQVAKGLNELKELDEYLSMLGIREQCVFQPFLARGLDIYTGTIYEVFLKDQAIKSSIGSGGRYDNAIGGFIGTDEKFPTVGLSFGLDVIYTALNKTGRGFMSKMDVDYYIIPLKTPKESLLVAKSLREKGYKVELELVDKKLGKALDKANKENVKKVIIVGEEEVAKNQITIKDMETGEETVESFVFNELLN
ncbi:MULTISPECIES: histidine--tRNA ligase [unclassified Oceanobacillus]|uniref:histidine--tRNA ligase n=1 Tax=unclassified Oceanobacillus TaxID=2630292 RepID=UPI00300DE433